MAATYLSQSSTLTISSNQEDYNDLQNYEEKNETFTSRGALAYAVLLVHF